MIVKKINILITVFLGITFYSCASFTKRGFRKEIENLEKKTINKLEGDYSFYPIRRIFNQRHQYPYDTIPDSLTNTNAYDFFVNEQNFKTFKITNATSLQDSQKKIEHDSLREKAKNYQINLSLESNSKLRVQVIEDLKVIKDRILGGKYKNGMFYLDNKYLDCRGIPFLFGGCSNNKRRIGLTKKGNLLINKAISNEGAFLLIIGGGHRYNVTYEFERK